MGEKLLIFTRLFSSSFLVEDPLGEIKVAISPPVIDISLRQKTVYFFSISLANLGEVDLRVIKDVAPFTFEENGTLVILDKPDRWSCVDWIELDDKEPIIVKAKKSFIVNGKISIPQDAVGGRHCAITFDVDGRVNLKESMGVKIKAGTLVFVSVSSTERKELVLESFSIEKSDPESVIFSTSIRNLSNTYLRISGDITIRDLENKKIKSIPIKDMITVLPEGKRIIRSIWKHPKVEEFIAYLNLKYNGAGIIEKEITRKVGYGI